ncbi:MAG: 16S rRNA (guanine(527)-N(7))-methyltransferase RsmG [Bacteroidaceae bacterium]|nr:16S rRNA (guanine(527)-N(7))-methyltransferase RsmG [Bacteroidaceae bacterium]
MDATIITNYFPELTEVQHAQMAQLGPLYSDWNAKINVISRKDIDKLYEHHVLHSLGIAKVIRFRPDTCVMDLGTGGGFPGIPLAILFPEVQFHLIDSVGKKIRVATEIATAIGLQNVTFRNGRAEEERGVFDFVVSRAVMPLADLVRIARKNISRESNNAYPNGIICLKGGELQHEISTFRNVADIIPLEGYFSESWFKEKKVVFVPVR